MGSLKPLGSSRSFYSLQFLSCPFQAFLFKIIIRSLPALFLLQHLSILLHRLLPLSQFVGRFPRKCVTKFPRLSMSQKSKKNVNLFLIVFVLMLMNKFVNLFYDLKRVLHIAKSVGRSLPRSVRLPRTPRNSATEFKMNNVTTSLSYFVLVSQEPFMKLSTKRIAPQNMTKSAVHGLRRHALQCRRKSVLKVLNPNVMLSPGRSVTLLMKRCVSIFLLRIVTSLKSRSARRSPNKSARRFLILNVRPFTRKIANKFPSRFAEMSTILTGSVDRFMSKSARTCPRMFAMIHSRKSVTPCTRSNVGLFLRPFVLRLPRSSAEPSPSKNARKFLNFTVSRFQRTTARFSRLSLAKSSHQESVIPRPDVSVLLSQKLPARKFLI